MRGLTHTGIFHADDVFASALLKIVFPDIRIERVGSVQEEQSDDVIIFDIGGGEFDHHQAGSPVRENGIPYAAFGLLWRKFGLSIVGDHQAQIFDENFVQKIDATDNGGEPNMISSTVSEFNPDWDEVNPDRDAAFMSAVDWAVTALKNALKRMRSVVKADQIVRSAMENADDARIIVLDSFVPWLPTLCADERPVFVVFPSLRGGYNAQVIPKGLDSREARLDFPAEWLEDKPEGLDFLHKGLFLISTQDKEKAIELCQLALTKR